MRCDRRLVVKKLRRIKDKLIFCRRFGIFVRLFNGKFSQIVIERRRTVSLICRLRRFGNRLRFGFRNVLSGCNFCGGITERYNTFVLDAFLGFHAFFFKYRLHFLLIGFYHFFGDFGFTTFAGDLAKIGHFFASAVTRYVFGLKQIDSAACFFVVKGSVNLIVKGSCYKCDIHNHLR